MNWNTDGDLVRRFTGHYATARGKIRLEMSARQIAAHLQIPAATVVDIGAGDGRLAFRLAAEGHRVTIVEPSPLMLAHAELRCQQEPAWLRDRVRLVNATAEEASALLPTASFDLALCHGVLMYQPDPAPVVHATVSLVKPKGLVSILTKSAEALAFRPGILGDFDSANASFDSTRTPGWLGVQSRGDTVEGLTRVLDSCGVQRLAWYGVGVFAENRPDVSAPDGQAWESQLAAEWEASRRDPYRVMARLIHVVGARTA